MMADRPLDIEMTMSAHPMASDTLFGALFARAERIRDEQAVCPHGCTRAAPLTMPSATSISPAWAFDDYDGEELFVLNVPQDMSTRRRNYSPVGTKSIDVDLRTRTRREEFLLSLKSFGCVEHANEWLRSA